MIDIQRSRSSRLALVIVALMLLVGCSFFSASSGEMPRSTITPSSTAPFLSPALPTQLLQSASPAPTLTPNPTPPLHPTLTVDEMHAYVKEMLTTNGGCELPCWWGVTPGKSSWQDANSQFPCLHFQFRFPEELGDYDIHLTLTKKGSLVQSIGARGYCFPYDCDRFVQDWARYSLDQVLSRYGVPSRVRIALALPIEPGGPIYYLLYVFYDNLGIGIRYMGPAVVQGELLRTCFSFEDITLWLQSPESSTPLEHAIGPDEWSFAVPLDKATGMRVEEFYEAFRQPGACLEAPPTFQ